MSDFTIIAHADAVKKKTEFLCVLPKKSKGGEHLREQGVGPCEPAAGEIGGIVFIEGFMHKELTGVCFGQHFQACGFFRFVGGFDRRAER